MRNVISYFLSGLSSFGNSLVDVLVSGFVYVRSFLTKGGTAMQTRVGTAHEGDYYGRREAILDRFSQIFGVMSGAPPLHGASRIALILLMGMAVILCGTGLGIAQLADTPWPMRGHDVRHTGQSPYKGIDKLLLDWKFDTPTSSIGSGLVRLPVIDLDGTIYVGSLNGNFYAINSDGRLKWKLNLEGEASSSPAISSNGTIYIGSLEGYLYAINRDGSLKWKFDTGWETSLCYQPRSAPAIGPDGTIYVGSWDSNLYAINPDGNLKWKFNAEDEVNSSPAIDSDGTIYVGDDNGNLYAINSDGSLKWKLKINWRGHEINFSPAIGPDGTIYVGSLNGNLYAINPDGSKKWEFETSAIETSPSVDSEGTVYVGNRGRDLYAINSDGSLKWKFETIDGGVSSPTIGSDGTIYVGDNSNLYIINSDGSLKWKFQIKTSGLTDASSPVIGSDGTIYVGGEGLYSFVGDILLHNDPGEKYFEVFAEDFESYPTGPVADALGSPWIRLGKSAVGDVITGEARSGQKMFQINSFTTSTEIDYVKLDLDQKPAQINVELWYNPYGYFIYKDFAGFGLGYASSKYEMELMTLLDGRDHNFWFQAPDRTEIKVFGELEYDRYNYIRSEYDFANNEVRFYVGLDADAPLQTTVNFDGSMVFNAFYLLGGLNPTYIDYICIRAYNDIDVVNYAPTFASIGDQVIQAGTKLNLPLLATDPDQDPITFSVSGNPPGSSFSDSTFTWTPSSDQVGKYEVTFRAEDGKGGTDSETITITVIEEVAGVVEVFMEDFESYPTGPVADALGSPWIRLGKSAVGDVKTGDAHSGVKKFQINSYTTSTEIDYVKLDLGQKPAQLNVELWYKPDSHAIYKDFAGFGLGYVSSKYDMDRLTLLDGRDHNLWFQASGGTENKVFDELEYDKYNYIRSEYDFINNEVRFYIGLDSKAPLRSTVNFDGSMEFNALYLLGGINPTYVDDIYVWAAYTDIEDMNRAPTLASICDQVIQAGTQLNHSLSATDPDGDPITFSVLGNPTGSSLSDSTFAWMPSPHQVGKYSVTFTAEDGKGGTDSETITITVIEDVAGVLEVFTEGFESYPTGPVADALGSPWVRLSKSRVGDVTTENAHSGEKKLQMNSFTTSTEIDYVKLDLAQKPARLNVELWYKPDSHAIYKDFAGFGLGYVSSNNDMDRLTFLDGRDHNLWFQASGGTENKVFDELEYDKYNYIRSEYDFAHNEVRFYIGLDPSAPLRSAVDFDGSKEFNALYLLGGLNPTYIDDIYIWACTTQTLIPIAEGVSLTQAFALLQNFPNPFNPVTEIRYQLPETSDVQIVIYNSCGQVVRRLVDGREEAGYRSAMWDAKDVASGVYFVRMAAGDFVEVRKMVLIR